MASRAALAAVAKPGDRIALLGPLGAGKTQFAKGFALGLGVKEIVNSPSFTLMAEYAGRLPLFHQDLYRLNGAEEVLGGGLVDDRQEDGVTLIEWGERLSTRLDARRLSVRLSSGRDDERTITVSASHTVAGPLRERSQRVVGAMILVLDTATQTPVVALAEDRRYARRRAPLGTATTATARSCSSTSTSCSPKRLRLDNAHLARSLLVPAQAASPACASAWPRPRRSPTRSTSRSLASHPRSRWRPLLPRTTARYAVTLPAGASDRYVHTIKIANGRACREAGAAARRGRKIGNDDVAIDLESAPASATQRGAVGPRRVSPGACAAGREAASPAVSRTTSRSSCPAYVALPRGIAKAVAEMEWSPDLR